LRLPGGALLLPGLALLLACRALLALGITLGRLRRGGRLYHWRAGFRTLRRRWGRRRLARWRHILRPAQIRLAKGWHGQHQGGQNRQDAERRHDNISSATKGQGQALVTEGFPCPAGQTLELGR
jgi:hypothetical protein